MYIHVHLWRFGSHSYILRRCHLSLFFRTCCRYYRMSHYPTSSNTRHSCIHRTDLVVTLMGIPRIQPYMNGHQEQLQHLQDKVRTLQYRLRSTCSTSTVLVDIGHLARFRCGAGRFHICRWGEAFYFLNILALYNFFQGHQPSVVECRLCRCHLALLSCLKSNYTSSFYYQALASHMDRRCGKFHRLPRPRWPHI